MLLTLVKLWDILLLLGTRNSEKKILLVYNIPLYLWRTNKMIDHFQNFERTDRISETYRRLELPQSRSNSKHSSRNPWPVCAGRATLRVLGIQGLDFYKYRAQNGKQYSFLVIPRIGTRVHSMALRCCSLFTIYRDTSNQRLMSDDNRYLFILENEAKKLGTQFDVVIRPIQTGGFACPLLYRF